MTFDEFSRQLVLERFAAPTPEWHPTARYRLAAAERLRLIEDSLYEHQEKAS
jgi:hypothetical protein